MVFYSNFNDRQTVKLGKHFTWSTLPFYTSSASCFLIVCFYLINNMKLFVLGSCKTPWNYKKTQKHKKHKKSSIFLFATLDLRRFCWISHFYKSINCENTYTEFLSDRHHETYKSDCWKKNGNWNKWWWKFRFIYGSEFWIAPVAYVAFDAHFLWNEKLNIFRTCKLFWNSMKLYCSGSCITKKKFFHKFFIFFNSTHYSFVAIELFLIVSKIFEG